MAHGLDLTLKIVQVLARVDLERSTWKGESSDVPV